MPRPEKVCIESPCAPILCGCCQTLLDSSFPQKQGLICLAAPSSYYDHNGHIRTNAAAFPHQAPGHASYYGGGAPAPSPSLGLYYAPPPRGPDYLGHHHHHAAAGFDSRKRAYDMVDDFFATAKRRQVDPASYASVGRSLLPLHGALALQTPAPMPSAEYMGQQHHHAAHAVAHDGGHHHGAVPSGPGPLAQQYYLPPMPNARTKSDLIQIDQILEQMQSTVYENANQATNGIQIHGQNTFDFRHSPSPPTGAGYRGSGGGGAVAANQDGYQAAVSAAHMASPLTAISSTGTPAVTPPSSNLSYTSGQSPSPSSSGMSPQSRHSSIANTNGSSVMYPNLPAVSSVFPGQSTTSTLGTNFDSNERRNYGGGMLQRANPAPRPAEAPTSAPVPGPGPPKSDPPRASPSSESETSESAREREEKYDQWLENMRTIEALREYIRDRIARNDYIDDTSPPARPPAHAPPRSTHSPYAYSPHERERDNRYRSPETMDVDPKRAAPGPAAPLYPILRMPN